MSYIFDIKNTDIFKIIKIGKNPLISHSSIFKNIFLFLFVFNLFLFGLSFLNIISGIIFLKSIALFFSFYLIFLNLNLFWEYKVKNLTKKITNTLALNDIEEINLAEFLSYDLAKIILNAVKFCEKRKISLNSLVLLYFILKQSKDVNVILFRLGLDASKIIIDTKNYMEKSREISQELFSDDFIEVVRNTLKLALEKGKTTLGETEVLIALSESNDVLKKNLMECDLKIDDVKNLVKWFVFRKDELKKSKEFWRYDNLVNCNFLGEDYSSGYTITLDKFSVDWKKIVSKWKFRRIIGHEKETELLEIILGRSQNTSALIVGNPGTGRKSIIQGLAQKIFLGKSLPELNHNRIVELDLVLLAAQIPDFEEMELILDKLFFEIANSGNVILVIDNIENFVSQKDKKAGIFDVSSILAKYLPLSNFRFVGITSYDGLHKNIEENLAFSQLFQKIEIKEISELETIDLLQTIALELEHNQKGIIVLYSSIREIVNLTARYIPSVPFPKKALDILEEVVVYVKSKKEKVVLPHHVAEIISQKTEIPIGKMEVVEKEVLLNLENLIHSKIISQDEAIKEISIALRRARSGIGSKKRPMGSFMFLGPTGVGKTETAKALSEIYFGSFAEKMIRLDMSEFQSPEDVYRLIGAITPAEVQGVLTTPVRENPFSLILLDEIEKAHPDVLNLFLQVLDEGHITDGQGRKVVFANTIIICTSNAGDKNIFKQVEEKQVISKEKLLNELFEQNIFKPEFINRFDAVVIFSPLIRNDLLKIADIFLQELQKNIKEKDIDFIITEDLKESIVRLSYKPEFGAREMRRVIQDKVENSIATALLSDKIKKGDKFEINPETFEIIVNPLKN